MTNDKATRQAIAETIKGELKTNWDLAYDIADAIISRLSELQPVNKADEELVKEIVEIMQKNSLDVSENDLSEIDDYLSCRDFESVARGIASILPRREADKELLEALIKIANQSNITGRKGCAYGDSDYDSMSVVYGYNSALDDCREIANKAIRNNTKNEEK